MGLLHSITQSVDLLGGDADGGSHPKLIAIDDKFEVEFAAVVDVVDDDRHDVLQLEGDSAHAIADCDVADLFNLASDFLEEEVPLFPGNFG